jgi:predicted lipoprotein with Yx(FWY)xxD motif
VAGVGAFAAAATATRAPAGTASSGPAKIKLERFGKRKILAAGNGWTIYVFTKDSTNPPKNKCVTTKGCSQVWPAVTTVGKPIAGTGVKQSLLGTIKVSGVGKQVTYNGHPLYTYSADGGPHQTFYVNFSQFGGRWPGINAKGAEVK